MTSPKPWPCYIAGEPVVTADKLEVRYPYDGSLTAEVSLVGPGHLDQAIEAMLGGGTPLTRHERAQVLETARQLLLSRADEFADLIRSETGLCMRETRYEVGRSQDVLQFAAMEALKDDGQIFSCDITPHGKARKIFTTREPLRSGTSPMPSAPSTPSLTPHTRMVPSRRSTRTACGRCNASHRHCRTRATTRRRSR